MADVPFQDWLNKTAKCAGVLACGVRLTNQTTSVRTYHESFPEARLKDVMQKITETAFNLRQSQLGGGRLRWTFEHGRIHSARRFDGVIGMLAVKNDDPSSVTADQLLDEFLMLERPLSDPPAAAGF